MHRASSIVIGIAFGTSLSVVFGIVVGLAVAILANGGPLSYLGKYPEMAIAMIPLWSLPSGLVGGLVCGIFRGKRILIACVATCIPAIFVALTGLSSNADPRASVVIGGALSLVALSTAATCTLWIRRMIGKRIAVAQAMLEDPTASPGKSLAMLVTLISSLLVLGGGAGLLFLSQPGAGYVLGLVVGGCWINLICGLQLLGSFPNRARIGWTAAIFSILVALGAVMSVG